MQADERQRMQQSGLSTSRIVDFVVCGTQKGGTSALDAYLRQHPEICMADRKELHFFDNEQHFSGGTPDYRSYHAGFSPTSAHRVLGEATPSYMYWFDAPRRMWTYNSNLKLIVLLRNPIERAYSHWTMSCANNRDTLSFWDAIRNEENRRREALPFQHRWYSYIDRGRYLEQLRRLWTYFHPDRVLILNNEELRSAPHEALQKVCALLGVSPFKNIEIEDVQSRVYTSVISREEKDYLRFVFEHEIHALERVLGWDCSRWLLP